MSYVVSPAPVSSVPVKDSDHLYAVNRIYCVGQNYGDHVREMGGDPKRIRRCFSVNQLTLS